MTSGKDSENARQLAYEIYEILEEYEDNVTKTTSKSKQTLNYASLS